MMYGLSLLSGVYMFKVKKCVVCGYNQFIILFDKVLSIACGSCGRVYQQQQIGHLPEDKTAQNSIRISVNDNSPKEIIHALPIK